MAHVHRTNIHEIPPHGSRAFCMTCTWVGPEQLERGLAERDAAAHEADASADEAVTARAIAAAAAEGRPFTLTDLRRHIERLQRAGDDPPA